MPQNCTLHISSQVDLLRMSFAFTLNVSSMELLAQVITCSLFTTKDGTSIRFNESKSNVVSFFLVAAILIYLQTLISLIFLKNQTRAFYTYDIR